MKHFIQEIGGLDFGEGVKFEPTKLLLKFNKDIKDDNSLAFGDSRKVVRFGYRKPQLAFPQRKLNLIDTVKDIARLILVDEGICIRLLLALSEDFKLDVEA
ncbi:uncharacterized protein [Rutidosis leptorrhynchoides]|uniref:uncharacterized protein n=1 Tax=Rutidosis leptorrhynchoides TaxID=125765 RepID=UPI003A99DFA9